MESKQLTIMAVHAHPDDEGVFTGGLLPLYHDQGAKTVLVTCTNGEEGEIHDPDLDVEEARPRLGEIRRGELERAVALLEIDALEYLNYRDSGMAGTEANNNPACFHMADRDEATDKLVALVRRYQPEVLITYDEFGSYGHPDHIAAHQITHRAYDVAGDPTYKPELGEPWEPKKLYWARWNEAGWEQAHAIYKERGLKWPFDPEEQEKKDEDPQREGGEEEVAKAAEETPRYQPPPATTRINVLTALDRKSKSLTMHRTQFAPGGAFMNMPEDIATLVFGEEHYILVKSRVGEIGVEDDIFAGIR